MATEPLPETLPKVQSKRVWITEFTATRAEGAASFAQLPALKKHPPLDLSDGLPKTATLQPETIYFRIVSETRCAFSTTGEATVDDILLPPLLPEYFRILEAPGLREISVILA
jgi:hypothetical protein